MTRALVRAERIFQIHGSLCDRRDHDSATDVANVSATDVASDAHERFRLGPSWTDRRSRRRRDATVMRSGEPAYASQFAI